MPRGARLTDAGPATALPGTTAGQLVSLDLIRGVAVLGILAVNIAGFAGPMIGSTTPNLPQPVGLGDEAAFAFTFLFFEGKMRALLTLLFGAGLLLFWERAEAAGENGDVQQVRRLVWLLLLGALHYLLLWWGDILFVYAACGMAALLMRQVGNLWLLMIALGLYYAWHLWGLLDMAGAVTAESALRHGTASAAQATLVAQWLDPVLAWASQEQVEAHLGWWALVEVKLTERPFWQVQMVSGAFSETLPLMLVGMVIYRRGFFDGRIARARLVLLASACTGSGLALTGAFLAWAWLNHFPPVAMRAALTWGLAMPHLMMGVGYAALLVLGTPRLVRTGIGARLAAAGRMAFSNYVLSSLVMTWCFYGWGLGLFGTVGPLAQWLFVLGGWAAMLGWSAPWLRRYRMGPLEWLWRSLVERRLLPNRIFAQ